MNAPDHDWRQGRITDEAVDILRSQVGVVRDLRGWNSRATFDAIWHFALGVGDDNPLWWDPGCAAGTRWGRMFAPPVFLYSTDRGGPEHGRPPGGLPEFEILQGVMGLWSSDRWVWRSHTWLDEQVRATTELHEVRELEGRFAGKTLERIDRTVFFGEDGRTIAELFHTVLHMERSGGRERGKYASTPAANYSAAEVAAIHDQYEGEPAQRRGGETLHWDDVEIGSDTLTLLKGPLTMTNLVGWQQGWGSLLCPTNRIAHQMVRDYPGTRLVDPETGIEDTLAGGHWDPYFAAMGGMPRGYDFGCQRVSWFAHLLTDWCGDDAFVVELSVRITRPNFLGDCTWLRGAVTSKSPGAAAPEVARGFGSVGCDLTAVNQRGEITARGSAVVALPMRAGPGA
jgi:acyl dehydratase